MHVVNILDRQAEAAFAKEAVEYFAGEPKAYTYADGDPEPGKLLAIRWNLYTVLVVRLDETHDPACYPTNDFIGKDLPPMQTSPLNQ